jgi:hypothetical protein
MFRQGVQAGVTLVAGVTIAVFASSHLPSFRIMCSTSHHFGLFFVRFVTFVQAEVMGSGNDQAEVMGSGGA